MVTLFCQCAGKFLADNIVGSVVVFSLLFWIPLSILVHCVVRLISQISVCFSELILCEFSEILLSFTDSRVFLILYHFYLWIYVVEYTIHAISECEFGLSSSKKDKKSSIIKVAHMACTLYSKYPKAKRYF